MNSLKADGTESAGGRAVQDSDPRLGAGQGGPHTHDWADVTGEPLTWPPSAHNHAGSEINSGTIPAAQLPAATTSVKGAVILATDNESTAGEAVQSNDTRMSNARTPVAHVHAGADVSSGTVPAAQLPLATTSVRGAVILSSDNEATAGEAVQANDTRMSNARTPVAHNHLWADTTDKPTTFTPTAHVHAGADI